jgi:ADP-L-glycero-D-manno-heptose 6-epimerase
MKMLITGAAGFIGSNLVKKINKELPNVQLVLVDDLKSDQKWKNLHGLKYVEYHQKSAFSSIMQSMDKFDFIIHLGACSDTRCMDMHYLIHNNYGHTMALAEIADKMGIPFIYASSAATYGDGSNGFDDNMKNIELLRPLSPYAMSKHMIDLNMQGYSSSYKALKFFNVFGYGEFHKKNMRSFVLKSFENLNSGRSIELFDMGEEFGRDFIYIDDVVNIILHFILGYSDIPNGIYNVGTGSCTAWSTMADYVLKAMDSTALKLVKMPENLKPYYQNKTKAETKKLREVGQYTEDFISMEDAVYDYIKQLKG